MTSKEYSKNIQSDPFEITKFIIIPENLKIGQQCKHHYNIVASQDTFTLKFIKIVQAASNITKVFHP